MKLIFIVIYYTFLSLDVHAIDSSGLQISVAGDFLYSQSLNKDSGADDKLLMRGAELSFYAPIDHVFEGLLSAAAHDEAGKTVFELHEMVISSSKLINRTHLKVGQFFLGLGKLNHHHQHDWSFTRAPYYHEIFFAAEGAIDTGLEYQTLLPTTSFWQVNLGLTSGYKWGHSHTSGGKPKVPTYYTRISTFFPFTRINGLEFGLNYLGRKNAQLISTQLLGIDLTTKWREGKIVKHKLQHETWLQVQDSPTTSQQKQVGGYFYYSYGLSEQLSIGNRLDFFKDMDKRNALTNKKINNILYTVAPDLTFSASEFSKIRSTLSHQFAREEGMTKRKDTRLELQFVFIIGGHPAHEF